MIIHIVELSLPLSNLPFLPLPLPFELPWLAQPMEAMTGNASKITWCRCSKRPPSSAATKGRPARNTRVDRHECPKKYCLWRKGFGDLARTNLQVATHNLPAKARVSSSRKVVAAAVCHSASLRNSSCAGEFMKDKWHWDRQLQPCSIRITRFTRCGHDHQPGTNFWNTAASRPPRRQWPFAPAILVS